MLKISTRTIYGIKALMHIYKRGESGIYTIQKISKEEGIPYRYLEQIFRKLRISGFIKSMRGPGGGYKILVKANLVKLGDIIKVLEGKMFPIFCMNMQKTKSSCGSIKNCISKLICRELDSAVENIFNKYSIFDLLNS